MKLSLLLFYLFIPFLVFSQTDEDRIIFLDSLERETNQENKIYTRVIKNYYTDTLQCAVYDFYNSGKKKMVGIYKNKYRKIKSGTFIGYYENGNKKYIINFEDNYPVGKFYSWYEKGNKKTSGEFFKNNKIERIDQHWSKIGRPLVIDGNGQYQDEDLTSYSEGNLKKGYKDGEWSGIDYEYGIIFTEKYKSGKLISGISKDSLNNTYNYKHINESSKPEKGIKKFHDYIISNIKIPTNALYANNLGILLVGFIVDKEGWITNVNVLNYNNQDFEKKVMNIFRNYDKWIPAKKRGVIVKDPIIFPIQIYSNKFYNEKQKTSNFN